MNMYQKSVSKPDGALQAYTWPGGYPLFYLDRANNVCCPHCAAQSTDVLASDVNWEDSHLYCDDCGDRIPSAYSDMEICDD